MARPFKLPDLGEGIHEGEVLNVLVSVGDYVNEDDPILEIETDKAAAEIPSPFTAKVEEIMVKAGDTVEVGDVLMTFSDAEEEAPEKKKEKKAPEKEEGEAKKEAEKAAAEEKEEEKPREKKGEPEKGKEPEEKQAEKEEKEEKSKEEEPKEKPERKEGPVPASPATRRLARELEVDLREVSPSGPGGRVTSEDVKTFAEKGKTERPEKKEAPREEEKKPEARPIKEKGPELPDFSKWGKVERIPVRSIRRATARQMALSWSQIPHVHNQDMVDMQKLEAFRAKRKGEIEEKGGKLTVTVFALKAAAAALKQFPRFNTSLDVNSGELVIKHYCHIGVAVSTEEGLVVPVVRDVDRKSMVELSIELKDLVERTRERKVSLEEMQGGTFTITNVGPVGGGYFAPVINFPEVAILGLGSIRMTPVARETGPGRYEMVVRPMMPMVLAIDHRVLDGADALQFTKVLIDSLEDPEELLMNMP